MSSELNDEGITRDLESGDLTTAARSMSTLKAELRDVSASLPAYDQRSYDQVSHPHPLTVGASADMEVQQIRELGDKLTSLRPKSKPKFNFSKSKSQAPSTAEGHPGPGPNVSETTEGGASDVVMSTVEQGARFEARQDEWITLPPNPGAGGSIILSDLRGCMIDLRPPSSKAGGGPDHSAVTSVHAEKLEGCVLLAEVGGSVMLSSISGSLVVLSCHQVRRSLTLCHMTDMENRSPG